MNFQIALFSFLLAFPLLANSLPLSSVLDGLHVTSFGRNSQLVIGDTVDAADPSTPKERCVHFSDQGKLVLDTEGSLNSEISINVLKNSKDFENHFNIDYRLEASASANFLGVVSGKTSLNSFGKVENYLKRQEQSLLMIIEANSHHGREMISDFGLKPQYKALLDKKMFKNFRKICGTHFVRGWTRVSSVSVEIEITELNQNAKLILEKSIQASSGGKLAIEDLGSAETKTKITSNIANTLKLAEKLGKVNIRVAARGGTGIGTISAIVNSGKLSDPEVVDNLLKNLGSSAKDFSLENSAPEKFIMVEHPSLNSDTIGFDPVNYEKLGTIFKTLVVVDQRLQEHNDLKAQRYDTWNRYIRVKTEALKALRSDLVIMYKDCKDNGVCDGDIPDQFDGMLLGDVFQSDLLQGRCTYAKKGDKQYLKTVSVSWISEFDLAKDIDFESISAFSLDPKLDRKGLSLDPTRDQRHDFKEGEPGNAGRIFVQLDNVEMFEYIDELPNQEDLQKIRARRDVLARSIYVVKYQTFQGSTYEHVVGVPELRNCPASHSI